MSELGPASLPTSYSLEWRTQHYNNHEAHRKIAARQLYYLCLGRERRGQPIVDLETVTTEGLYMGGLDQDGTVVDVGCAYPYFLMQLESMGHSGQLYGIEPNTAQFRSLPYWQSLAAAENNRPQLKDWRDLAALILNRSVGEHPRLQLLEAPAGDIPLPDGTADAVSCMFMFYHVDKDRQHQTLSELRRLLRPNGLFALTTRARANKSALCHDELLIAGQLGTIMNATVMPPAPTNSGFTSEDARQLLPRHFNYTYELNHADTIIVDDVWSANVVERNHWTLQDLYMTADASRQRPTNFEFGMALGLAVGERLQAIRDGRHIMTDILDESAFICSDRPLALPGSFKAVT